jgi:hypothetical protein
MVSGHGRRVQGHRDSSSPPTDLSLALRKTNLYRRHKSHNVLKEETMDPRAIYSLYYLLAWTEPGAGTLMNGEWTWQKSARPS